ncbi:GTP-binding protein, partial [Methanosarcinales archaeon]
MIYEKLRTVPTADELIDLAFRRALRSATAKKRTIEVQRTMVRASTEILSDRLLKTVHDFPNFDELSPFYSELTDILVGIDELRMSLSSLQWAGNQIQLIARETLRKMRSGDPVRLRKACYARISSIVHEVDGNLSFLNDARNILRKLPDISDVPTIVVAGYPNVGKSSFVRYVTDARPEIASYPFTTKGIYIGHFSRGGKQYQIIDTPGLLDRPLHDRNNIELQAITALRNVGTAALFL